MMKIEERNCKGCAWSPLGYNAILCTICSGHLRKKRKEKKVCLACRRKLRLWQRKCFNRYGKPFVHYKHTLGYGWYKDAKKGILHDSEEYIKMHRKGTRLFHQKRYIKWRDVNECN